MTMHVAMVLPFAISMLFAVGARRLAAALPPATGVRLLTLAGVITAAAVGFVLSVVAFTFIAQDAEIAAAGHWSVPILRAVDPMPPLLGGGAAVLISGLALAALVRTARAVQDLVAAALACRRLGSGVHGLVVVNDDHPDAYALPGVTGRVVVSTAMLRALPVAERRALLAHESSHLRHRHHLYVLAADIAAAANPLLRPAAHAVRAGIERWADEDAAVAVADRRLVARTLARAARATSSPARRPVTALGMDSDDLVGRARALLLPAPTARRSLALAVLTLIAVTTVTVPIVARSTEVRFERAQATWPQQR
jgi:Zn-dependent protease with chaperone function